MVEADCVRPRALEERPYEQQSENTVFLRDDVGIVPYEKLCEACVVSCRVGCPHPAVGGVLAAAGFSLPLSQNFVLTAPLTRGAKGRERHDLSVTACGGAT